MPRRTEGVDIEYRAKLDKFEKAVKSIPGITKKESAQMAREWKAGQKKMDKASTAAAKKTQTAWKQASTKIRGELGGLGGAFDTLNLGPAALVAGMAAVGVGALTMAKRLETSRQEIVDVAQVSMIGVEALAALELAGAQMAPLGEALGEFNKRIVEAGMGTGRALKWFQGLNIEVEDLDGNLRSTEDIFKETITKLQGLEAGAEAAGIATALFGAEGKKLLAVLGTTDLEEWERLSERFGLNMGTAAANTADLTSNVGTLKIAFRSAADDILSETGLGGIASGINAFARGITFVTTFTAAMISDWANDTGDVVDAWWELLSGDGSIEEVLTAHADVTGSAERIAEAYNEATLALLDLQALQRARIEAGRAEGSQGGASGLGGGGRNSSANREIEETSGLLEKMALLPPEIQDVWDHTVEGVRQNSLGEAISLDLGLAESSFMETEAAAVHLAQTTLSAFQAMSGAAMQHFDTTTKGGRDAAIALFAVSQAAALADIGIRTAQAVMVALTVPPPAGQILAAATVVAGVAAATTVAATPPPSFPGGGVVPSAASSHPDHVPILAQPGEGVINRRGMAALDSINAGGGSLGQSVVVVVDGQVVSESVARAAVRPGSSVRRAMRRINRGQPRAGHRSR